jgi:hypothetical protein
MQVLERRADGSGQCLGIWHVPTMTRCPRYTCETSRSLISSQAPRLSSHDRSPHRSAQPTMGGPIAVEPAMPDHRKRDTRRTKRQWPHSQWADRNETRGDPPRHHCDCFGADQHQDQRVQRYPCGDETRKTTVSEGVVDKMRVVAAGGGDDMRESGESFDGQVGFSRRWMIGRQNRHVLSMRRVRPELRCRELRLY